MKKILDLLFEIFLLALALTALSSLLALSALMWKIVLEK